MKLTTEQIDDASLVVTTWLDSTTNTSWACRLRRLEVSPGVFVVRLDEVSDRVSLALEMKTSQLHCSLGVVTAFPMLHHYAGSVVLPIEERNPAG